MKAKKLRIFAVLLSAAMCLGLLAGCGGDTGGAGSNGTLNTEGNTIGAGSAGKDSKSNTLLYITKDNQWMISKAEDGVDNTVLATGAFLDETEAADLSWQPQAIPGLHGASYVWFSADGKHIYFLKDIDYRENIGTLCHLNCSDLQEDFSNSADCVSVIAENVVLSVNNQIVDNGILYRTISGDLCYYDGTGTSTLARDVLAASRAGFLNQYVHDALPSTGDAAFILADNGKSVVYSVLVGDSVELRVRAVDGDGEAVVVGRGVKEYYCNIDSDTVFYIADGVYAATFDGEVTELADSDGRLISSFGRTAYYVKDTDGNSELFFYDGKESNLICANVDDDYVHGDAENQIALYINDDDDEWYCAVGDGKASAFAFENGKQRWQYCGALDGGKEIVLCATDGNKEIVAITISDDTVADVKTLATGCWRVRIRNGNELFFIANYTNSDGDFMLYCDGEFSTLGSALSYYRTNTYSDNVILALKWYDAMPDELVLIDGGTEKHIANETSYFLRLGSGEVLYISDSDGALYMYADDVSVRLFENVALMFCANGEYNSGATYIEYPEFGSYIGGTAAAAG